MDYSNVRCDYCFVGKKVYRKILIEEGLGDWTIKFNTGGGLCLHSSKQIWLDKYPSTIALFLHEVAHAFFTKKENEEMRFRILDLITKEGFIEVREIINKTRFSKTRVEQAIKWLRENKMVESRPNIRDMRRCLYGRRKG